MEMDDLPFDVIGPDENGNITKLVEIDDIRTISVVELVALDEADVKQLKDPDLEKVWRSYMSLINIKDYNVIDIMECVKQYKSIANKRKEQLNVLSSQEDQKL